MKNPRGVTLELILLEGGILTSDQLKTAREKAREQKKRFTDVLLDDNFMKPDSLASALSFLWGAPVIMQDLETLQIDAEALACISEKTAKKYNILPLTVDGLLLRVAMENTGDIKLIDMLVDQTGKQIRPALPHRPGTVRAAIKKHYGNDRRTISSAQTEPLTLPETMSEARYNLTSDVINKIISQAIKDQATEIHLEPHIYLNTKMREDELKIFYLIAGKLRQAISFHLNIHKDLVACIKSMAGIDVADQGHFQEGKFTATVDNQGIVFRVVTIGTSQGEMVIILQTPDVCTDSRCL